MANAEFFSFGDEDLEVAEAQRADELSGSSTDVRSAARVDEGKAESRAKTSPFRGWPLRWIVATVLGAGFAAIVGVVLLVASGDQDGKVIPSPSPVEQPALRLEGPDEQARLQETRDRAAEHRRVLRRRAQARRKAMRRRARRQVERSRAAERRSHQAPAPTSEAPAEPLEALPPVAEPTPADPPPAADEKPRGDGLRDGSTSPEFGL